MNILILIDAWYPFVGGAQVQIKNLTKILKKNYGIKYYILHSPSANILLRFLWCFWVIPQAIWLNKKYQFDLIHAHAYWPGIPGKILSKILNIPIVFTVHGSNLLDLQKISILYLLERFILCKIKYDWVISVSTDFLKYKNVNKYIYVIPNGVDVNKFNILKKDIKNNLSTINNKQLTILFVGRVEEIKGVKYLIKAYRQITKQYTNVRLTIIGDGSQKQRLIQLTQQLGISDKITWKNIKKYKDLIKEYKKSDIFVLPSLSEGQPITLLEAWAAKLTVVVTSVGENPRMVKEGINGYLVKHGDVKDLAKGLTKAIENKNRKKLGKNGFNLVKNKYTWKNCAKKTYEVYKKVI